MPFVR